MSFVGSKWYKVDFHCHSPASGDFPRNGTGAESPEEWLLTHMAQEVDCGVLSDHNTGQYIDEVQAAIKRLRSASNAGENNGFRELAVIPAVELTAAGNCHVLGLFDESASSETISHVVGDCGISRDASRGEKGNHETVLHTGVYETISKIHAAGGLAILAHVDQKKGIFENSNQGEVREAFEAKPDAIELIGEIDALEQFQQNLIADIAHVKGSDSHCLENMGSAFTWVKMIKPSYEGIKAAIADPRHCIIRDAFPPKIPENRISRLSVKTLMCQGESNNPLSIDLSPWYTAIIGSRGSGKSTLVESIRLALRRDTKVLEPKLPDDIANRLVDFKKTGTDGAMSTDSEIEAEYNKGNHKYKLIWSPDTYQLQRFDAVSHEWVEDNTFDAGRFPISVYSQKMLFDIATKPGAFLRVIDDSEIVNFSEWNVKHIELASRFKELRHQSRDIDRQLAEIPKYRGLLTDINNKLEILESCGLSENQSQLSAKHDEKVHNDRQEQNLLDLIAELTSVTGNSTPVNITENGSPQQDWLLGLKEVQEALLHDIEAAVVKATKSLSEQKQKTYYQELSASISELERGMKEALEALASADIRPSKLGELLAQKRIYEDEIEKEIGLTTFKEQLAEDLTTAYDSLASHRSDLTNRRKLFIESLRLDDLQIKILPLACNSPELVSSYQRSVGIDRFNNHILEEDESSGLLQKYVSINRFDPQSEQKRHDELTMLKTFHQESKLNSDSSEYNIHGTLKRRICQLTDEHIDNFFCWFPDDGVDIKFIDESKNRRALEKASPGQKSASMLTFLMSYGTDPLILDQPEDDLDCAMLSQTIIPAISKNKQRRQLIIVTHSAPLVVNGDAELIVGMKQQQMRLQPNITGGIQEKGVRDFICAQMEGGEKAFKSRFRRIVGQ